MCRAQDPIADTILFRRHELWKRSCVTLRIRRWKWRYNVAKSLQKCWTCCRNIILSLIGESGPSIRALGYRLGRSLNQNQSLTRSVYPYGRWQVAASEICFCMYLRIFGASELCGPEGALPVHVQYTTNSLVQLYDLNLHLASGCNQNGFILTRYKWGYRCLLSQCRG